MVNAADHAFMTRALFLAERGRGRTSPNPIVGAVVVSPGGVILGHGAHLKAGGPHAEVVAIDAAGERARGATLYCTLEPCCHHGRTGPCTTRILDAGIARVVIATRDQNPRVAGKGTALLRSRGVEVDEGVGQEPALRQNAAFFTWITRSRPFVVMKAAVSRDGFMGQVGPPLRLTGARADQYFQQQRAEIDAMAVGAGTVLSDDPLLTPRGAYRFRPLTRVVFDWRCRVPATARLFSTLDAGPVIMVVSEQAAEAQPDRVAALEAQGVVVRREPARQLAPVLGWLAARDVVSLLIEGGPALHAACRDEGLVDRVQYAVAPRVLGTGIAAAPMTRRSVEGMRWPAVRVLGQDALIEFDVHRSH